ncbi:hypothetical protein BRD15_04830 [Halobacteriales archaeon SW_6_65_15]|jgi:hypothetical protein|nr:MAG: hypothetical protein BRD15_04830 [Halobacteriales archaeon SW_6_65_15]
MSHEAVPEASAPTAGVVASLAVLAVVVVPYFLIPARDVGIYYGAPTFVPIHLVIGLFATVAIVIFAAGRNGRTDPPTAAGATLVLGGFMALLVLWWAIAVGDLVGSFDVSASFDYHRWLLLAATVAVAGSGWWFTREVL